MIGIDILENERVKDFLKNPKALNKVLTENEKNYVSTFSDITERVAGIFCAKEAIKKATQLPHKLSFLDIEILHNEFGAPVVNLLENSPENLKNKTFNLSISHSKTITVAVCVMQDKA